jgi:hypothetical protein
MKKFFFDRSGLVVRPLSFRQHDIDVSSIKKLDRKAASKIQPDMHEVARRIIDTKNNGSSIVLMAGAHVVRSGVQNFILDLMKRGYISCLSMNGAGMIHDFEFALIGATTESVARYIKNGQFGLWKETGKLNDIINKAYYKKSSVGMGEAVGKAINKGVYPFKDISLLAGAWRLNIPVTIHVGIGQDIIHEHPNCDGAATGATSYNDFLQFTKILQNLEGGVVMNFGSAVMAPEVYLKALSMVRNRACKEGRTINRFTSVVCDVYPLPTDFKKEPSKDNPAYYFRPWKTMLLRTVADGGESFYIKGKHADTIPSLWTAINEGEKKTVNSKSALMGSVNSFPSNRKR